MIGCLRTRVRKQPIIGLYFESETVLKFDNLEAWTFSWLLDLAFIVHSALQFHCHIQSNQVLIRHF